MANTTKSTGGTTESTASLSAYHAALLLNLEASRAGRSPASAGGSAASSTTTSQGSGSQSPTSTRTTTTSARGASWSFARCSGKAGEAQSTGTSSGSSKSCTSNAVWFIRSVFWCSLLWIAILLGSLSVVMIGNNEQALAERQWETVSSRYLAAIEQSLRCHEGAAKSLANMAAQQQSRTADWPHVVLPGFEDLAQQFGEGHCGGGAKFSFAPMLQANSTQLLLDLQTSFESFAYQNLGGGGYQDQAAPLGIWKLQDGTGSAKVLDEGNDNEPLFPLLQTNTRPSDNDLFLWNLRSDPVLAEALDELMECTEARKQSHNVTSNDMSLSTRSCEIEVSSISQQDRRSYLLVPVYPQDDPSHLAGVILAESRWDGVLANVMEDGLSTGITMSLQAKNKSNDRERPQEAFWYSVNRSGSVVFRGQPAHPGHLSTDPKFHSRQRSIELRVASSETAPAPASSSYVLTLYPNREFCDTYKTKNPQVSSIGAVLIVVAMSILFWLYDYFVRKEFNSKQQLLEAKRYFMRFVSHEVRTPLNAVCLGLALLKEELDDANAAQEPPCNKFSSSTSTSLSSSISSSSSTPDVESFSGLVNDICDSAESAVQVLNDLLQYDKIQMGKFTMENTVISIVDLVQDISKEFRLSARKKNIAVTLDTSPMTMMRETTSPDSKRRCDEEMGPFHSPQDFKVVGDKIRITQILRNLVSNAVKFVPEQGHITLRLSWVPNSNTTSRSPRGNKGCDASWHERYATLLQHRGDHAEPRNKYDSYTLKSGQEVSYERQGMLHLDVIDTGAGMTPSQLKKLFQDGAQFNVNELQAGQGSGLGLFLSKSMAQQHGGELSAASQGLGKGTTFTFTLPLYFIESESSRDTISKSIPSSGSTLWKGASTTDRCSESDEGLDSRPTIRMNGRLTPEPHNEHAKIPTSTLSTDPVVDQSHQNCSTLPSCQPTPAKTLPVLPGAVPNAAKLAPQPQLRILVVDDVPSNRKLLARMARNRKHNVDEAYDGQHAVEKVMESLAADQEKGAANPYQVILMDFEMPRLNGPDATRRIREMEGCQDMFIVGVTGNVLAEDVARFLDSGADHVLPKPVKFPALEALWKDKFRAAGAAGKHPNS